MSDLKPVFRDKQKVRVRARVTGVSATGDYCIVEILTRSGTTHVAVPVGHLEAEQRPAAHELEKCVCCDKNIDTCCAGWFYGDTEGDVKVHNRCEKRWAKICNEINAEVTVNA